jgi:hypothetical protein
MDLRLGHGFSHNLYSHSQIQSANLIRIAHYHLKVSSTMAPTIFCISFVFCLIFVEILRSFHWSWWSWNHISLVWLANWTTYSDVVITAQLTRTLSNLSAKLAVDPSHTFSTDNVINRPLAQTPKLWLITLTDFAVWPNPQVTGPITLTLRVLHSSHGLCHSIVFLIDNIIFFKVSYGNQEWSASKKEVVWSSRAQRSAGPRSVHYFSIKSNLKCKIFC